LSGLVKRLVEAFSRKTRSGYALPQSATIYETPSIPLAEVIKLYEMGFYTTVNEGYDGAGEVKQVVDQFSEDVNLDALLCDMARVLIACGNDFWLRITPESLRNLHRLPVDAIERIEQGYIQSSGLRIPYGVEGYKLRHSFGGEVLEPEAVIHWRINCISLIGDQLTLG